MNEIFNGPFHAQLSEHATSYIEAVKGLKEMTEHRKQVEGKKDRVRIEAYKAAEEGAKKVVNEMGTALVRYCGTGAVQQMMANLGI